MRKIYYYAIIIISLCSLFIDGCKKTSSPNGLLQSFSVSNTVNGNTTSYSRTYTYDAQNQLTELQQTDSAPTFFSYATDSVTETKGSTVTTYQLNSQGLAASTNTGNSYTYNNSGYCINITNTSAGTSTVNTVANDNIINTQITKGGTTTAYAYTFLNTTDYRTYGVAFLGQNNVNLVNTLISNGVTYNYTYTFDSKGRVLTQKSTVGSNTQVVTYGYVYQ